MHVGADHVAAALLQLHSCCAAAASPPVPRPPSCAGLLPRQARSSEHWRRCAHMLCPGTDVDHTGKLGNKGRESFVLDDFVGMLSVSGISHARVLAVAQENLYFAACASYGLCSQVVAADCMMQAAYCTLGVTCCALRVAAGTSDLGSLVRHKSRDRGRCARTAPGKSTCSWRQQSCPLQLTGGTAPMRAATSVALSPAPIRCSGPEQSCTAATTRSSSGRHLAVFGKGIGVMRLISSRSHSSMRMCAHRSRHSSSRQVAHLLNRPSRSSSESPRHLLETYLQHGLGNIRRAAPWNCGFRRT